MILFLVVNLWQSKMLLRKNLLIRLRCFNVKNEKKVKSFKINECKNKTKVFYYDKDDVREYFKDMKKICKENVINRRKIKLEMIVEKIKEKREENRRNQKLLK
jgi:hypothetical protein